MGVDYSLVFFFNFGSLLGFFLFIQIFTGFLLVFYFNRSSDLSFFSVQYVIFEVTNGWLVRLLHFNGASFFFVFLYMHFFKGFFFSSWNLFSVWFIGLFLFLFLIVEAFLGYSLLWSQMSYWAATVITSLLSVIPFFGKTLVFFIWGGFCLNSNSLNFFFFFHFVIPFLIIFFVVLHLFFLHFYGRRINLGLSRKIVKRSFFPFFWLKDFLNFFFLFIFFSFCLLFPFFLGDSLGFVPVNILVSPVHIIPEWYFLWVYAILRTFPSKVVGVFILIFSICIFFFFYFFISYKPKNQVFIKLIIFFFEFNSFFLTWLGGVEPVYPFLFLGYLIRFFYFFFLLIIFFLTK